MTDGTSSPAHDRLAQRDVAFRPRAEGGPASPSSQPDTELGFVRFLVHELRNMVAPIRNAAHILRLRSGTDADLRTVADIVERQVEGIGRLLNVLADAERARRGEIRLENTAVDLVDLVQDVVRTQRSSLAGRRLQVEIDAPQRPVVVHGDPARLTQIYAALLDNAAQFSPDGGRIEVEVTTVGGIARVVVRDAGAGISPELLPRLFDFFTRLPTPGGKGGLGVSLAIARRLAELHSGRIEATSAGAGKGSAFTVFLPLASAARTGPAEPHADSARGGMSSIPGNAAGIAQQRRILIADDNAAVRVSLGALLQDLGHVVQSAADGEAALEIAQDWMPEFVFLDLNMPKLNGVEVARRLRSRFPATVMRLVMMSGSALDEPTLRNAKRIGFDHCIDKIGDPRLLAALLADTGVPPAEA